MKDFFNLILDLLGSFFGQLQRKKDNAEVDKQVAKAIREAEEEIAALDELERERRLEKMYRD